MLEAEEENVDDEETNCFTPKDSFGGVTVSKFNFRKTSISRTSKINLVTKLLCQYKMTH